MVKILIEYGGNGVEEVEVVAKSQLSDILRSCCNKFKLTYKPNRWALRREDGSYVSQRYVEEVKRGMKFVLKADPFVEVEEILAKMKDVTQNKMAMYMLFKVHLQDDVFLSEWGRRDGMKLLIHAMLDTRGSLQSLSLRCMAQAMELGMIPDDMTKEVFSVILELCGSLTITTCKSALLVAKYVTASESLLTFEDIEWASQNCGTNGWDILISQLESEDVDCIKSALATLNNIAVKASDSRLFLNQLDDLGLLEKISKKCLGIGHFLAEVVGHQRARLDYLVKAKATKFDGENPDHVGLLKEMWEFVFPDEAYPGDKGSHWDRLGFQGKSPETDLRGAGLMGLQNLHYMAEVYPDALRSQCAAQAGKSIEESYYPVATAGINVSVLLYDKVIGSKDPILFLFDHPNAFEEVYCATMKLVDNVFMKLKSTYMEFTSKVMPQVIAHLDQVLSVEATSVDVVKELLEADESELRQRILAQKSGGGGKSSAGKFILPGNPADAAAAVANMKEVVQKFARKVRIHELKQGTFYRRVLKFEANVDTGKARLPVQLSQDYYFVRLSNNEQDIEYGHATSGSNAPVLQHSLPLNKFKGIVVGAACPTLAALVQDVFPHWKDQCIQLVPSTDFSAMFVLEDLERAQTWSMGLKALFGEMGGAAAEEERVLLDAEIMSRRFTLEDLKDTYSADQVPNIPPPPENYDFEIRF